MSDAKPFVFIIAMLILLDMMMMGFLYFSLDQAGTFRSELIRQNFEYQKQVAELLARSTLTEPLPTAPP